MMNNDLPCITPDSLYYCEHYVQQLSAEKEMADRLPFVTVIHNSGGTELECYPLDFLIEDKRNDIENFKDSDDIELEDYAAWEALLSTYESIAEIPLNEYSLHKKAQKLAR